MDSPRPSSELHLLVEGGDNCKTDGYEEGTVEVRRKERNEVEEEEEE